MKFQTFVIGNLRRDIEDDLRTLSKAAHDSLKTAGRTLKDDLGAQVRNAGLGSRLAHTWKVKTYRNADFNGACLIFSKSPQIIESFDQGATIRASKGKWLAIPTPSCPRRGIDGKRITPRTFPEKTYGRLRFAPRRYGHSLLVVDDAAVTSKGRVRLRKTGNSRVKRKIVAMFVLLPQVRLAKRLDVARAASVAQERLVALLDEAAANL